MRSTSTQPSEGIIVVVVVVCMLYHLSMFKICISSRSSCKQTQQPIEYTDNIMTYTQVIGGTMKAYTGLLSLEVIIIIFLLIALLCHIYIVIIFFIS